MKVAIIIMVLVGTACAADPKPKGFIGRGMGYRATLNAPNQKPSTGMIPNSNGVAEFSLEVDEMAQSAKYSFWMANIEGYTMSHIHVGGPTASGPVAILLLPGHMAATNASGALPMLAPFDICTMVYTNTFTAADLFGGSAALTWAQFMSNLKSGNLYVNVHNQMYPAGVIRGQLMLAPFTSTRCPKTKTWWTATDLSAAAGPMAAGAMPMAGPITGMPMAGMAMGAGVKATGPKAAGAKAAGSMAGMP